MEPSLRSSTQRGTECKLRRTEPALHEATQRFVESLCPDVRISQYSDLNFAAKKFGNGHPERWCILEPVPGGRVGYLVLAPNRPAVWLDDQLKQSVCVQMRVESRLYQRPTVFIASLNKSAGLLRLEDTWHIMGKSLLETPFTQRWENVLNFFHDSYKPDLHLQQGLRIEPAIFHPLTQFTALVSVPIPPPILFAQGETAPRRLRIQIAAAAPAATHTPAQGPRPAHVPNIQAPKSDATQAPGTAIAVAHEEYPDTYNLFVNGVKKGYAAVQDLALSRQLRLASKELVVRIEWNEEFKMYEILSQV